VGVKNWIGI
jgi:hypothetical protein